jgi:hypothetical protein
MSRDPVQDILDTEKYIKDNLFEACKELVEEQDTGVLRQGGVITTARSKIEWLNENVLAVETIINRFAVRLVATF